MADVQLFDPAPTVLDDLRGEHYRPFLARVHAALRPASYLEIGTEEGQSLALAGCASIAVDPVFRLADPDIFTRVLRKPSVAFYQMTSDQFFERWDLSRLFAGPVDMAFLDGCHQCDVLLRDFMHTEKHARRNSLVILHDCLPVEEGMTTRSQADSHTVVASHHGWWTGDVWRTALLLKRVRPDLRFLVLDAAPTGLVLITNLDPTSRKLADGYEEYVAKMLEWQISGGGLEALHAEMRVQPTQAFADPESMVEFVQGQRAPMRTLVFCTAFARTQEIWRTRYRRWIDILRASSLEFQQLLIVDDGSPVLPDWSDAQIVTEAEVRQPELLRTDAPLVLYHYMENLGRREIYDFPGWYRSFAFAARYAGQRKFEKVIHLESDAYLLSPGMHAWANRLDSGWIALYSPKYEFPEMAIQLVAGPEVQHFAAYFAHPYDRLVHRTHELALPYTHVERGFKGDRYGESLMDVPKDADYVTQVQTDREDSYYWWAGGTNKSPKVAQVDEELTIDCSEGGNSDRYIGAGWAYAEPDRRWMIGEESTLRLPPLLNWRLYTVLMSVIPHVSGTNLLSQRLLVKLNGGFVASFSLEAGTTLAVELPVDLVNIADSNVLTFEHPDACAPSRHSPSGDHRELAIAVTEISLRSKALVPNVL